MPDFALPSFDYHHAFTTGLQSDLNGIRMTANAAAHTKGAYVTLLAATPFDAHGLLITFNGQSSDSDALVDIAIGTAGNEDVILSNLYSASRGGQTLTNSYFFPMFIPKGSQIRGRAQTLTGGQVICAVATLFCGGWKNPSCIERIIPIGVDDAATAGTQVDAGATINTKGAWVELDSASDIPIKYLLLVVGNKNNTARVAARWAIDLGIGGAGSEVVIVPDLICNAHTTPDVITPQVFPIPTNIPVGTRLAARAACSSNDATGRLIDVMLYGGY